MIVLKPRTEFLLRLPVAEPVAYQPKLTLGKGSILARNFTQKIVDPREGLLLRTKAVG